MCKAALKDTVEHSIYPGYVASLHLQTVAAMAYALERSKTPEFKALMKQIVDNSKYLCEALKKRGFGIFTGGTDCHMFLLELHNFGVDGVKFSDVLEEIGITVNSKGIPFDTAKVAMGVRMGTTVLTQRGMKEPEMDRMADILLEAAKGYKNEQRTIKRKKQQESDMQADIKRFRELFPDTSAEEIPDSVWAEVENGIPLAHAFALYTVTQQSINALAEEVNRRNGNASAAATLESASEPVFTKEAVEKMSQKDIKSNYKNILKAMKSWRV
jgi:hypothetical protein